MRSSSRLVGSRWRFDRESLKILRWLCSHGSCQCFQNARFPRLSKSSGKVHCTAHIHRSWPFCSMDMYGHRRHYLSANVPGSAWRKLHRKRTFHSDLAPTSSLLGCRFALQDILVCIRLKNEKTKHWKLVLFAEIANNSTHHHRRSFYKLNSLFVLDPCIHQRRTEQWKLKSDKV